MRGMVVGKADRWSVGDKWMSSFWRMYLGIYWFLRGRDQNCPKHGGFEQELAHSHMLIVMNGGKNGSKALL